MYAALLYLHYVYFLSPCRHPPVIMLTLTWEVVFICNIQLLPSERLNVHWKSSAVSISAITFWMIVFIGVIFVRQIKLGQE